MPERGKGEYLLPNKTCNARFAKIAKNDQASKLSHKP